jgi:8-hydroxy-5-deazaflavin:NADPH oxidoreductase
MKYAVLGTGMVGTAIATKLAALGYEVTMGSRTADNAKARAWAEGAGPKARHGTFADAAAAADVVFNCTLGAATLDALDAAGADNLAGKILVDVANPLDFSQGMPPTLFITGADSLGERVQAAFPRTRVVKALNTINAELMVDAARIPGEHVVFVSGNDPEAKAIVTALLREGFGWRSVLDLGDITTARGTESYLPLWIRLWGALGTPDFNLQIVRA